MKGTSENNAVDILCGILAELEIVVVAKCWLSRVPSYSNIADKPSRGNVHKLVAAGYVDDSDLAVLVVNQLFTFTFMNDKLGKGVECSVDIPI